MIFTVSDIKQFLYCPRIVYFTYVMPVQKKTTFKMEYGKEEHSRVEELEQRRRLKIYGLREGKRLFQVHLKSERLGLSGILDMLIISDGRYYPVDFKDSTNLQGSNHRYQLTAYSLLVEERFGKPVRRGFIHLISVRKTYAVDITQNMRDYTKKVLTRMARIVQGEIMPPVCRTRGRCLDCEFRLWCGDV